MSGSGAARPVFTLEARVRPSWEGRLFDEGPEVAFEISPELPEDLRALSACVSAFPVPPEPLEAAVARALERDGGEAAALLREGLDPRLARALGRAALDRGLARSTDSGDEGCAALRELEQGAVVGAMQVLAPNVVALLVHDARGRPLRLEVVSEGQVTARLSLSARGLELGLPRVLRYGEHEPRLAVSLLSRRSGRVAVWVADASLRPLAMGVGVLEPALIASPRLVALTRGRVHALHHRALAELRSVEPTKTPRLGPRRVAARVHGRIAWPLHDAGRPMCVGEYLVTAAAPDRATSWDAWDELLWLDLEEGAVHRTPSPRFDSAAASEGALWLAASDGLYSALPGFSPSRVLEGCYRSVDSNGSHVYALSGPSAETPVPHVVVFPCSGGEGARVSPVDATGLRALHTSARAGSASQPLAQIEASGTLHVEPGEGELSAAEVAGLRGVCRGDQVFVEAADGAGERRLCMPYRGALLGGSAGRLIFGPQAQSFGAERADGLYAIDADGQVERLSVESGARRWPAHDESESCTGSLGRIAIDAVYRVDDSGRRLSRWVPSRSDGARPLVAPARERERQRGEVRTAFETRSPRDDYPMVGLSVSGVEGVYQDGHYAGTTGLFPAPGVRVERGAVALVLRCTVAGGIEVRSQATLFLVECEVRGGWHVAEGAHLVMLGCRDADGPLPDTHPAFGHVARA